MGPLVHVILKDSPVHETLTNAEFRGKIYFIQLCPVLQEICKRLFPRLKPVTSRLYGNNFTISLWLPFGSYNIRCIKLDIKTFGFEFNFPTIAHKYITDNYLELDLTDITNIGI